MCANTIEACLLFFTIPDSTDFYETITLHQSWPTVMIYVTAREMTSKLISEKKTNPKKMKQKLTVLGTLEIKLKNINGHFSAL